MGNAVTLSIALDGDYWHRAGTPLQGRIDIEVHRKIAGQRIALLVKGKEKSCIKRGKQTRSAHRVFFRANLSIGELERRDQVDPGTYSFPFSVNLPDSLPTDFSWGAYPNACSIQYKCVASVGRATAHKAFGVMSSPLRNVQVPCFLEPRTQEISALMGLQSRGSITFGVGVEDTHIGKGQEVVLSVACQNDTTVDVERVCVKVVELVTFRLDGSWRETRKTNLVGMTELNLPGLVMRRKSKEDVKQDKRAGGSATLSRLNYPQIYAELSSGRNTVRIRIPQKASDSYEGTLLSVKHYIKLYLKTPATVMDIEKKIPLRIGFPAEIQQATRLDVPQPAAAATVPSSAPVVPFATAIPVPFSSNSVEAPVATASASAIVLGGGASTAYDSSSAMAASSTDFDDLVPLPPPQVPSLRVLLEEMTASVNDIDIISNKLNSPDWRPVITGMSPADYGAVVAHVNMDFDQPRVGAILAPHVNGGNCFTCVYCLSAIQNAAEWNRTAMVQKLLPLCVDIQTGFTMIQQELSPWEQTVTERDFQYALDHSER